MFYFPKRVIIKDKILLDVCMGFIGVLLFPSHFLLSLKEWQK